MQPAGAGVTNPEGSTVSILSHVGPLMRLQLSDPGLNLLREPALAEVYTPHALSCLSKILSSKLNRETRDIGSTTVRRPDDELIRLECFTNLEQQATKINLVALFCTTLM